MWARLRLLALISGLTGLLVGCAAAPPACRIEADFADQRQGNAGCLIASAGDALLLVHRPGDKLGFPGGTARSGEPAQCTAHRETWEETGLDVSVGPFVKELSTGFLLYACRPMKSTANGAVPRLRRWSRREVSALVWRDLDTVEADEWRFPEQLDEVRGLLSNR